MSITAQLCAKMLESSGADSVITLDLHSRQIEGFFNIPVDTLIAQPLITKWITKKLGSIKSEVVLVSPDAGGVKRVTALADSLELPFAIIHKERYRENHVEKMILVGDVRDKITIIIDDMADTCETLRSAADTLQKANCKKIIAIITHGIFSGPAIENLSQSCVDKIVVTNSLPQSESLKNCITVEDMDISCLLAEAIRRTFNDESLKILYENVPPFTLI